MTSDDFDRTLEQNMRRTHEQQQLINNLWQMVKLKLRTELEIGIGVTPTQMTIALRFRDEPRPFATTSVTLVEPLSVVSRDN